jgi:hypothetical protein
MSTLGRLKVSVDSWLTRDDVAVANSDFPEILLVAESELARRLRLAVQEATTTLNFTGRSVPLPTNFLEARTPFIDSTQPRMEYMTPAAIRESNQWIAGRTGAFYTLEGLNSTPISAAAGMQMTIAGPASVTTPLTVTINYWARLPALVADTDTNWLLANHYDVYLYAVLRAAAEWIQENELEDRYRANLDRVIGEQILHENRKRYGAMSKAQTNNPRGIV